MNKQNIAIIFGGKSLEHEVSIVTAIQVSKWLDKEKYNPYLIYVDKNNQSFLCPNLKENSFQDFIEETLREDKKLDFVNGGFRLIKSFVNKKVSLDAAILAFHGGLGENGGFQGMMEFLGIPYSHCGVMGSALGMDKATTKMLFNQMGLSVAPGEWFFADEYRQKPDEILEKITKKLKYPVFVKPVGGGSTIGVLKVENLKKLKEGIEKTMEIDSKILVEQGIEEAIDINCSVKGGYFPVASACEQPIKEGEILTFEDKYLKGGKSKGMAGLCRIFPASIPEEVSAKIQEISKAIFREFGCWGVIRIDYLYQKKTGKIYANELNTIPGSFAFYFWQHEGISPTKLVDELIELALSRKKETERLSTNYESKILDQE